MDRSEAKIGLIALGLGTLYFGIRGVCSWLINRTYTEEPTKEPAHITGKLSQKIGIYSYENNPRKWSDLEQAEEHNTFDLVPVYFRIVDQTEERIVLEMPTKKVICKFSPTVDVHLNLCKMIRCTSNADQNYNGVLNYLTQLFIELRPDQQVIVYGHLDANDIFHINRISNYPRNKYDGILRTRKMWKIGFWIFGFATLSSLAFLFPQHKE